MRLKQRKWLRRLTTAVLVTSMTVSSGMVSLAAPESGGKAADINYWKEFAAVDFSNMNSLDSLSGGWSVSGGGGTAELVEAGEGAEGKALKLTRSADGANTQLIKNSLGINESDCSYVSIETKLKLSTESHANQWSIPYIKDKSGQIAYTLFTDGNWDQYKTHIGNKNNSQPAGAAVPGTWQTVRMDINLEADTFRVSVDGTYVLYDEKARTAGNSLDTIQFYSDSWGRGTVYIQSVKVLGQKKHETGTAYYVSSDGDDNAAGTSEETAWKTLGRVNREHFIPGDQILFRCGDEWEDETLFPQGSGSAGKKIVISSYGEGAMPKISKNGKGADAVCLYNQEYWEITGLDISNTVEGFSQLSGNGTGDGTPPATNNGTRNESDGKLLGDYRGIHIAGRDVASLKGYHLHDLLIHDVTGVVSWIGDTGLREAGIMNNAGLDGSKRTGGILIECLSPSGKQPTQFSDIVIEKSEFINNSFCAVTVKQWNGSGNQYGNNPGWANRSRAGGAPDYYDSNWYPHSNIIIQDNYINQGASAYACNGIYLTSSRDSVIQRNVLEHIGTCGIELYFTDNVAVQYNEVSDIIHKGGGADNNAIDPDWRVTNALIQYNYIHEAGEGFLLCGVQFNSGVIRYNLVQDCSTSYVHYSMGSGYFQIYNNIFYRSKDGNGTNRFDPWGGGNVAYFNNVFYDGKKQGFQFSGGASFAFDNNAYYGTAPTSKDKNPIMLTEDPFEGEAPSLDRMGSFETGVLLEANGLRAKADSPLIGAGVSTDPNGYSIDDGLKSRGQKFNFTSLDKADTDSLGNCINIGRTDYPAFEKTGVDAIFDSAKTQTAADSAAPTIGMFEVLLPADAVILRGTVTEGLNPAAGLTVEITIGDKTITATTNESGAYSILEGLVPGEAKITVTYDGKDITDTIQLEGGKVNRHDVTIPMEGMPEAFSNTIIDESFDEETNPANFGFSHGTKIENGMLVLTAGGMGNASTAVKTFGPEVAGQKAIDLTFDYYCKEGNKQGFEFRDSYGRLLFAICAAAGKNDLRPAIAGGASDDSAAAWDSSAVEPAWDHINMNKNTTYKIHVHADFEKKTVSYSISEKDGKVVAQKIDETTEATNLAKMISCAWWDSKPQYMDNFKLTAPAEKPELPLEGKTVYAFGDSIVAGHKYTKHSFIDFAADQEGMELQKFAVNGAAIMDANYSGGQIIAQINSAPEETPDYVIFNGGTNDAEYLVNKDEAAFGTIGENSDPESFDLDTFAGAFEKTICEMKEKWPESQLIYVAVHKLGSRDKAIQEKLHELELMACGKWGVAVANLYDNVEFDTSDESCKNKYTFDSLGGNGLPGTNGSGTHPNFAAIEDFYLPVVTDALRKPEVPTAEKEALTALIEEAEREAEKTDIYSSEAIETIKKVIEEAKKTVEKTYATQKEVDDQLKLLKKAVDELKGTETGYYTERIEVTKEPDQTEYEIGEAFEPDGMEVTVYEKASASDASRSRVLTSEEYKAEHDSFDTPGTKKVTVVYHGINEEGEEKEFRDSFVVEVTEESGEEIYTTGVEVTRKPNKLSYETGEAFDPAGMKVVAYEKASASNAARRARELDPDEYQVEHEGFDTAGTKKVTVSYEASNKDGEDEVFTDSFTVKVTEAWEECYTTGIEVKKKPDKTVYKTGEDFKPDGMKVVVYERRASSSNAERRERVLSEEEYDLDIPSFETQGSKIIKVLYEGVDKNGEEKTFRHTFTVKVLGRSVDHNDDNNDDSGSVYTPNDNITGTWQGGQNEPWKFKKSDGTYATNEWAKINGKWYHFDQESNMQVGWLLDQNKWYILNPDGSMCADIWIQVNEKWYYFNSDGSMKCNEWYFYKDSWYYLGADGDMLADGMTPDGYRVDQEGKWIK
ncbi:bacterial Ig-like domain-containing protein [Hungatella sp.]|uniref:bacterial Ig-like domain-containing protein n=1 Tax=Hungatella sp. TaxID=2613924 RepID=UPI002A7F92E4|nr:bacterial Ig-like domain-containing protein [Hungatella sp.]